MSLQINFTKLTDCGCSATSDLGSGIADAIGFDIANYDFAFKEDEDYDRLEGNGYFEENYPYRHESDKDLLDGVNYCAIVVARSKVVKSIAAHIYKQTSTNGFPIHRVLLLCSDTFFEKIRKNNIDGNLIQVNIKLSEFIEHDYYDKVSKAEVEQVTLNNNSKDFESNLIDKEIEDIKNYLIKKSCVGKYGQIAEICNEFAQSFRHVTKKESKFDLVDEIISLISSFRFTFHRALNTQDEIFISSLKEKYDFNIHPYDRDFEIEFTKITDKKELNQTINIFNHLWTRRKAEKMFKDGFPFGAGDAELLAEDYLKLKFVKSEIVEKIIIDLLISTTIGEKASSLQYNKQVSVKTLLSIPIGVYNKENNSKFSDIKVKEVIILSSVFLGMNLSLKVIFGLFEWWFSGLIAGDNETAHIILFGILFAADSILMYFYQKSDDKNFVTDVPNKIDEMNYYFLRDLCNLHTLVDSYKGSSFKFLLHKVSNDGTIFSTYLYSIVK
jgi:hypothetical protein